MGLPALHIEQRLGLSKTARDVVLRLVCLSVVDGGQRGCRADKQQRGSDSNDGSCVTWSQNQY
jgi:hypothetical protein